MSARLGIVLLLLAVMAIVPTVAGVRQLSFEDRVAAQRAIEQVYWSHRIWPDANPQPKPSLEEVLPASVLRAKVEDTVRLSHLLESVWSRPITAEQLQAEMERMASGSQSPEVLRELFAALDDDPFMIAECLARPALVERLAKDWFAFDPRFQSAAREKALAELASFAAPDGRARLDRMEAARGFRRATFEKGKVETSKLHGSSGITGLEDSEWHELRSQLASTYARSVATAENHDDSLPLLVLSELEDGPEGFSVRAILERTDDRITLGTVSWPKASFEAWSREEMAGLPVELTPPADSYVPSSVAGGCTDDTWQPITDTAPVARYAHVSVWTGTEMIVWGGADFAGTTFDSGARYNPATDTWQTTNLGRVLPDARWLASAVWTGTEMIVWGGLSTSSASSAVQTGARYDPASSQWLLTSTGANVPAPRYQHTAVWSGSQMIVWGGRSPGGSDLNTGGRYDPATDSWLPMSTVSAAAPRSASTAVWTGSRMLVWGGNGGGGFLSSGGRYDPASDTWSPMTTTGAPSARRDVQAVWTGAKMVLWGGYAGFDLASGGRYDPATDSWTATSTGANMPPARHSHNSVWTGTQMLVWGGYRDSAGSALNDGARYDPVGDTWTTMTVAPIPGRYLAAAEWTGTEMVVWGGASGSGVFNTGARYDPLANSWVAVGLGSNGPYGRIGHTALWTGTEMIIWGASRRDDASGGRYDPATDTWTAMSVSLAPAFTGYATAIWTGTEMIVWGGENEIQGGVMPVSSGGRYNPATNSWTLTPLSGAPAARSAHSAVWTGTEMIVWGGWNSDTSVFMNSGGRYRPVNGSWTPTTTGAACPSPRADHDAVWTGTEMIVWSGWDGSNYLSSGARYRPGTDSWTSMGGTPPVSQWGIEPAVWTGTEMIVHGGNFPGGGPTGGARYDPAADSWTVLNADVNAATSVVESTLVWTGTHAIAWGLTSEVLPGIGGRYFPSVDLWLSANPSGEQPHARFQHTAVWTGTRMIIWGGFSEFPGESPSIARVSSGWSYCSNPGCSAPSIFYQDLDGDGYGTTAARTTGCFTPPGYAPNSADCDDTNANVNPEVPDQCDGIDHNCDGRAFPTPTDATCDGLDDDCNGTADEDYAPQADEWSPLASLLGPGARWRHRGVDAAGYFVVWGGETATGFTNTGGRYSRSASFWHSMSTTNAPSPRVEFTMVANGAAVYVWGGESAVGNYLSTGARYDAGADTWQALPTAGAPTARSRHTAVWTGSKMIVWGGMGSGGPLNSGGLYDPSTSSWTSVATAGAPSARADHTAVWTGTRMIVWGGIGAGGPLGDGALYDPATNSWSPIASAGAPSARSGHTAVFVPGRMIVWGGQGSSGPLATGGLYALGPDSWSATSTVNAPAARVGHLAVATPSLEMLVWGGSDGTSALGNGKRYDRFSNVWFDVTLENAPSARAKAAASVASDGWIYVWGGSSSLAAANVLDTGSRYHDLGSPCGVGACVRDTQRVCSNGSVMTACTPGPPATETCNGLDDDCDGTIDNALPPGGGTKVTLARAGGSTSVAWTAIAGAQTYDAVRGVLSVLRSTAGNFTTSTDACIGNDLSATTASDPALPTIGNGFWYLVRGDSSCTAAGTYDSGAPSQIGSRDAEIAGAASACP